MKLLTKATFILLLLISTTAFSQETYFGGRLGLNISNLNFDSDIETDTRLGLVVGGFMDAGLSEKLSLLVEAQYSAEGSNERELRADYVQVPVMLRFNLGEWFKIGLGPQAAIKVWSNEDGFQNVTFSGLAGAEYMFTDELFFDLRYSFGLSDVLDEDFGAEAKNQYIQLGFGIKL